MLAWVLELLLLLVLELDLSFLGTVDLRFHPQLFIFYLTELLVKKIHGCL